MGSAESSYSDPNKLTAWNPNGRVLLYVDNTNVYLSTQAHAGKLQRFPAGVSDLTCRLHLHILIEGATKGRNVLVRNAYGGGAMASQITTRLEQEGINVFQNEREEVADTQLAVDAVEDILLLKPLTGNPYRDTVLLFGADQTMRPIIQKARKHGWNVEVWAYSESVHEAIKMEQKRAMGWTKLTVLPLEDYFVNFVYYDYNFAEEIPPERTLLLTFKDGVKFMTGLDPEKKASIRETLIREAKKTFMLPMALQNQPSGNDDFRCALIITLPEVDGATGKPYYNFDTDVFDRRKTLIAAVETYLVRNFGGKKKLKIEMYASANATSNSLTNPDKVNLSKATRSYSVSNLTQRGGGGSNYNYRLYKTEYCTSMLPSSRRPCKHESSTDCTFAHFKEEIKCHRCGVKGNHAASKCILYTQN